MRTKTWVWTSVLLEALALLAVIVSHLALTDIYHGEADVSLEWNVLRLCFGIIVLSQIVALISLTKVLRGTQGETGVTGASGLA